MIILLAPVEPEPQRDWGYINECRNRGHFPALYLLNYSVKHVTWHDRQRFWSRLCRGILSNFGIAC